VSQSSSESIADEATLVANLTEFLAEGRIRIVFVLDTVPNELVRLVGFLEQSTQKLLIDLVTVSAHKVGDARVVVPHRVEPEREFVREAEQGVAQGSKPVNSPSAERFIEAIPNAPADVQPALRAFVTWAESLAADKKARLVTAKGNTFTTLKPIVVGYDAATASAWIGPGTAPFWLHRTVVERLAPTVWPEIERMLGLSNSKTTVPIAASAMTPELLALLSTAYVRQ
jgi:hypothetical protein